MARILIDPSKIEDSHVVVRGGEAKHLLRVLRLRVGSTLVAFDGAGAEWPAIVKTATSTKATLELGERITPQREPNIEITVAVGLPKGETLDAVVRALTELGVARIVPVHTERAIPDRLSSHKLQRLERIALDACKQSGRNRPPQIDESIPLQEFLTSCDESSSHLRWVLWEESDGPLPDGDHSSSRATLLIGPEGGLSSADVDAARTAGFVACSLGPRILRVHTAAVAAVTALLLTRGDMG